MLDMVRYLVVWNPVILCVVHIIFHWTGLDHVPEHHGHHGLAGNSTALNGTMLAANGTMLAANGTAAAAVLNATAAAVNATAGAARQLLQAAR